MGVIPGGPLAGDLVVEPVSDWRFTDDDVTVAVETQGEWFNHSVTTLAVAVGPNLYVPAREGFRKRWVANAVRDPRVKIGVDGRIYKGKATRVTDPDEAAEVGKYQLRKYLGMDVDEVKQLLDPPAPGDDRVDLWIFRVESVGADW
jgi:hypothetical protein